MKSPRIPARRRARVHRILAVLAELQAFDDARRARGETVRDGEVDMLLHSHMFDEQPFNWGARQMRAFVLAACLNAPDRVLTGWVHAAGKALEGHRDLLAELAREEAEAAATRRAKQERVVAAQLEELSRTNPAKFDEMLELLARLVAETEREQAGAP